MGSKLEPCSEAQSPHLKLDGAPPGVEQPKVVKAIHATNAAIHLRGRLDMQITMIRSFLWFAHRLRSSGPATQTKLSRH